MKIYDTQILLIEKENIDKAKLHLADTIVKRVSPLFDDIYISKHTDIETKKEELKSLREQIVERKNELQTKIDEYNRRKKVKKLLDRIDKLVKSGLVYDGKLKHETVILLKIIDKLPEEKIEFHSKDIMSIISRRFAKK